MPQVLNSATDVILQCARTFLSSGKNPELQTALAKTQDWQLVERTADDHCVMPLVAFILGRHGNGVVPMEVLQRFRERSLRLARNNLAWGHEWQRILRCLSEADIPAVSFKGPALALAAYHDLALREFHDLDLLVRSRDVAGARDVLVANGYTLWSQTRNQTDTALVQSRNQQICFTSQQRGTAIDLHWGAVHEMFSFQLEADKLWQAAYVARCGDISFLSLAPEHLLLYLCAHGTKHCWRNLCWLCDVAALVQAHPHMDWHACIRSAEAAGCDLLLKHTLLFSEQVLGVELPEPIKQYSRNDARARTLSGVARQFLLAQPGDNPGYLKAMSYHLAFARRGRDRARLVFERVFVPAEPDWNAVRLPNALYFLYYVVRPVRFILGRLPARAHHER